MIIFDCTKFPAEVAAHDEALARAADLAHMSECTGIIWLYPVAFRGCHVEACMRKVRLAEDRMLAHNLCMLYEFTINFVAASEHAGDRRPLTQRARLLLSKTATNGGDNSPWTDTELARGRLPGPPIELPRVKDLQTLVGANPAETAKVRTLGPADRIAQRGPAATAAILRNMVQDLKMNPSDGILVGNFLPNPMDEWGVATWELEKNKIGHNVNYLALPTDSTCASNLHKRLRGIFMEEWWESRPEAGVRDISTEAAPVEVPKFRLVSWIDNNPIIPEAVQQRFAPGTTQADEWELNIRDFWAQFGKPAPTTAPKQENLPTPLEGQGPDYDNNPGQDMAVLLELQPEDEDLAAHLAKPDSFWRPVLVKSVPPGKPPFARQST